MKKLLELQDFHVSPSWINESKKNVDRVCEVAHKESVDAILIAGDWLDKQFMASDKGCWGEVLEMGRQMQNYAQVYFVTGTPGHDSPGCYESFKDIGWIEVGIGQTSILDGEVMIMGIPRNHNGCTGCELPGTGKS